MTRTPGKGKFILTEHGELLLGAGSDDGFQATAKAKLLQGTCYTAPTLANGKLFLRSDKEMVCLNLKR